MIKNIHGNGKYMQISGGYPPNTYAGSVSYTGPALRVGDVRFNSSTQNFEVCDGSNWVTLQASYAGIG